MIEADSSERSVFREKRDYWGVPLTLAACGVAGLFGFVGGLLVEQKTVEPCPKCQVCGSGDPLPEPGVVPSVPTKAERLVYAAPLPSSVDYGRTSAERAVRITGGMSAREGVREICKMQRDALGSGHPQNVGKKVACYGTTCGANGFCGEGELWWELRVEP